jgi:hypothetical protein
VRIIEWGKVDGVGENSPSWNAKIWLGKLRIEWVLLYTRKKILEREKKKIAKKKIATKEPCSL